MLSKRGWIRSTGDKLTFSICCAFLRTSSSEDALSTLITLDFSKLYLSLSSVGFLANGMKILIFLLGNGSWKASACFRFLSLPACWHFSSLKMTSTCSLVFCLVWVIPLKREGELTKILPFKTPKVLQALFSFRILLLALFKTVPLGGDVCFNKHW